jgi:hypothetical protein
VLSVLRAVWSASRCILWRGRLRARAPVRVFVRNRVCPCGVLLSDDASVLAPTLSSLSKHLRTAVAASRCALPLFPAFPSAAKTARTAKGATDGGAPVRRSSAVDRLASIPRYANKLYPTRC